MSELTYLWLKFLWELYLGSREKRVYRTSARHSLPDEVQRILDEETYERARAYSTDRVNFLIIKALYDTVLNAGFLVFNGIQRLWDRSEYLVGWTGLPASEALTICVFLFLVNTFNTFILLPVELHAHFQLEKKHGFNRLSIGYFAKDRFKVFLVSQLVTLFVTFVAVKIVINGGDYFYLYLWLFLVLVFFFVNFVYPDFVAPMFDTFYPLPEGELRNKIQTLTSSVDFPVDRVFVLESSPRTAHSDAYHMGLYKSKKIVLFDSLLQGHRDQLIANRGLNNDEVLGVVAHELGHWSFNHILKFTTISLVLCLIMLVVYGPSMKEKFLQKDFGFNNFLHSELGVFFLLNYFLSTRVAFVGFGLLWISRSFESQADGFAGSLGLAPHLRTALIKVHRDNLLFPVHDWLYSMSYYHHPSLLDRLRGLDKYN